MLKRKLLPAVILVSFFSLCFAENKPADSLKVLLQNAKDDTSKVKLLLELSKSYWSSSPEEVIKYGMEAKKLSEALHYKSGLAYAYKNIGRGYFNQGSYLEALQNYENSLAVFDSINDKSGVSNMDSQLGNIYFNKGDDSKALELFLKSLKLSEELKDTLTIVTTLNNIGAVYLNKKQTFDKALINFLRAIPLAEALGDNNSIGTITVNIGEIYLHKAEELSKKNTGDPFIKTYNDSALFFFNKSLKAYEGTEDATYTLNDIGKLYRNTKDYSAAIRFQKQAYEIAKAYDAKNDMAIALLGLAQTYLRTGDKLALATYKQAEAVANETESKYSLKDIYNGLAQVYAQLGDFSNAFKYQNLLIALKDTIYNLDTDKKLGTLQFTFDIEKKQGQIDLLTKDQEIKEKEISRQKLVRNGFIGGFAIVLLFAGVFFTQRNKISKEKKRSDELLLNILPEETAEELKETGSAKVKSFESVTVMFTDFKGFTQTSELLSPEELVKEINHCYCEFDRIITRHGVEKIKTIGDSYMCAGGLPVANTTHPSDVVKAGIEMQEFMSEHKRERVKQNMPFFELRLGIHTGPVVAGIVGIKKFAYDIWGDAVNTASRMESSGEVGEVNISHATYEKVKDRFNCVHRGKVGAKGKGHLDMYFVRSVYNLS